MKITKLLLVVLVISMVLAGMVACDEETVDENAGACDMVAVKNEIDSMRVGDFTETDKTTEYVKITFKDYGELVLRLREDVAPITARNFQKLVADKFYDGLTIHRIVEDFMIQGGDPKGDGTGGSKETIKGEFSQNGVRNELSHITGVISMGRLNNDMDSASSQFFICNANAGYSLDGSYAAFGYVVAGLETLLMVSDVEVKVNIYGEVSQPVEKVIIDSMCFVEKNQ